MSRGRYHDLCNPPAGLHFNSTATSDDHGDAYIDASHKGFGAVASLRKEVGALSMGSPPVSACQGGLVRTQ